MATINALATYLFRNFLSPSPGRINEEIEAITIPGIDYAIMRKKGFHPRPFTMESVTDFASGDFCESEYTAYTTAIGAAPCKIIWNSYDYDRVKLRFAVTNVELISIRRNILTCGSLRFGGVWDLRARWTGLLVPFN